jgi:penicillin-binding protein 1A
METEFNGEPVAGGTFPAGIFKTFVESALRIYPPKEDEEATETPTIPAPSATAAPAVPEATAPPEETAPAPEPTAAPPPAEEPAPVPESGGEQAPQTGAASP